jgi:hypothetical protein
MTALPSCFVGTGARLTNRRPGSIDFVEENPTSRSRVTSFVLDA